LAKGLVENDSACCRNVERADTARHGDAEKVVTGAADKVVESSTLAAEDQDAIAREVELVVILRTTFIEADDP
jgi:hypothetical protein